MLPICGSRRGNVRRIKGFFLLLSLKMTSLVHFEGNGSCLEVPILLEWGATAFSDMVDSKLL